jgi:hypothetical protein
MPTNNRNVSQRFLKFKKKVKFHDVAKLTILISTTQKVQNLQQEKRKKR